MHHRDKQRPAAHCARPQQGSAHAAAAHIGTSTAAPWGAVGTAIRTALHRGSERCLCTRCILRSLHSTSSAPLLLLPPPPKPGSHWQGAAASQGHLSPRPCWAHTHLYAEHTQLREPRAASSVPGVPGTILQPWSGHSGMGGGLPGHGFACTEQTGIALTPGTGQCLRAAGSCWPQVTVPVPQPCPSWTGSLLLHPASKHPQWHSPRVQGVTESPRPTHGARPLTREQRV